MVAFAEAARLSPRERQLREEALAAVRAACGAVFPASSRWAVPVFGSYVHGLGLPGADLDLVVTGVIHPSARGGGALETCAAR